VKETLRYRKWKRDRQTDRDRYTETLGRQRMRAIEGRKIGEREIEIDRYSYMYI